MKHMDVYGVTCRYYSQIYAYCLSNMRNVEQAEDVVQEVFLTLQLKYEQVELEQARSWLYSTARLKMFEAVRARIRAGRHMPPEEIAQIADPTQSPELWEETLTQEEIDEAKARILRELTPQEQALFTEIYVRKRRHKEVAKSFSVTENALNVRLFRLRAHIHMLAKTALMCLILMVVKWR